jgi:hypothetical protein
MKTTKEKIEVMQAFVDGKTVEVSRRSIRKGLEWFELPQNEEPFWHWQDSDYRIKAGPKLRPWKLEEIPVGALMKLKSDNDNLVYLITGKAPYGSKSTLWLGQPCEEDGMSVNLAFNNWLHSLDHGKTWHPCGVIE